MVTYFNYIWIRFVYSFFNFIRTKLRKGSLREGIKTNIEAGALLTECVVITKTIIHLISKE